MDGIRVELYRDNGDGVNNPAHDTLENFTVTTNGGAYTFSNLDAGDYYAVVYVPPTYSLSPVDQSDEALDSDGSAEKLGNLTVAIMPVTTLDSDEIDYSWDQGLFLPSPLKAAVGDYVWFDEDSDGTQNESAANGINGINVYLYEDSNPTTPILTSTTSSDINGNPGYYLFDQLDPGDYFIDFELPGGATFTTQGSMGSSDPVDSDANPVNGRTETFNLEGGEYDPTWQAGIVLQTGSLTLGDRVWHDANNDGNYDPFDGELGIDNVSVNLYIDTDGSGDFTPGVDQFRATTTTYTKAGERGYYEFTDLPAGDYIVQIGPKNFEPGLPLDGMSSSTGNGVAPDPDNDVDNDDNGEPLADYGVVSASVTLSTTLEPTSEDGNNNTNMTVDFGFYIEPAAIGNYVWYDENHDGIQDESELPIEGVTVTLTINYPNGATVIITDVTDAQGHYSFDSLLENENYNGEPPSYVISAESPAGHKPTIVNASGSTSYNDSNDPSGTSAEPNPGDINVSATATTTIASYDFGFWQPLAIGNFVWNDTDGATPNNGIYEDGSESGIDGMTLQLYRDDGDGVFNIISDTLVTSTVTDNGFYEFGRSGTRRLLCPRAKYGIFVGRCPVRWCFGQSI